MAQVSRLTLGSTLVASTPGQGQSTAATTCPVARRSSFAARDSSLFPNLRRSSENKRCRASMPSSRDDEELISAEYLPRVLKRATIERFCRFLAAGPTVCARGSNGRRSFFPAEDRAPANTATMAVKPTH